MKQILFCVDLDGTLLDSSSEISEKNKSAIQKFKKQGHIFVTCTGRNIYSNNRITRSLSIKTPFLISCNGSRILDNSNNKLINKEEFKKGSIDKIIDFCLEKNIMFQITNDVRVMSNFSKDSYRNKFFENYFGLSHFDFDRDKIYQNDYGFYILLDQYLDVNKEMMKQIFALSNKDIQWFNVKTHDGQLISEFVPANSSKGNAVEIIAKKLNIHPDNIACAGDSGNDVSMLKKYKLSFCPSNGTQEAKNSANYPLKVSNNEDFIAEIINNYLLKI